MTGSPPKLYSIRRPGGRATAVGAGIAAALLPLAWTPAIALAAPVLQPLAPCYVAVGRDPDARQAVQVGGSGFTPGALVDVAVDGATVATGVAVDAAGALPAGSVPAPFVRRGSRPFTVTVREQGDPSSSASASALVTRLAVRVRPRTAGPARRVRFRGSGFTAAAPVFAHYVRRGRERRTVRLARRADGPCGAFDARRRLFPFLPSPGRWELQVDQQRRYSPRPASAYLRLRITVRPR